MGKEWQKGDEAGGDKLEKERRANERRRGMIERRSEYEYAKTEVCCLIEATVQKELEYVSEQPRTK